MLRKILLFLTLYCALFNAFAQQKFLSIIDGRDTVKHALIYNNLDSLEKGELRAYYKQAPTQIAVHKKYYLGKQSGVTKTYFSDGSLYERIIYQNGKREGDYGRYNRGGELIVKAQYAQGVKNGFYINLKENFQGRFRNGKKEGKWKYNVKTPEYKKEFYSRGVLVEKRQIHLPKTKVFEKQPKRIAYKPNKEDSLLIPFMGDTAWYQLKYVSQDSLPHPAMRKAFFKKYPDVLAHTKYVYNGYVNGMYKVYFPNGNLYLFVNYTAGQLDGAWKQYDENEILRTKGKYLNGLKTGKWEYNIGTLNYRKEKYRSGMLQN